MKLQQYIEQLTALMNRYHAQDFDVKTREILLDQYGGYPSESVTDVTGDHFCLDLDAQIAFVDCESSNLKSMKTLIDDWKSGTIETT